MTANVPEQREDIAKPGRRARCGRVFAYPVEAGLLIGLIFFLPIFEAPKNILVVAYLVAWLVNRARAGNWGGAWDGWDSLILLWIASGYVVAVFAGIHHNEWRGAHDILRYGSALWMVKRSGYGQEALQWLLAALALSTVLALAMAYWELLVAHTRTALELHSVGHVNHSAIYVTIAYGAMLFATIAHWSGWRPAARILASLVTSLFALSVLVSASRGAVGIALLLTLIAGVVAVRRSPYFLVVLVVLMAAAVGAGYWGKAAIVQKEERDAESNNILSFRNQIWDAALVAWKRYPAMGLGMDNFEEINAERLREWVGAERSEFSPQQYRGTSHAHNLFLNTLAERGLFGFAVLMTVLLAWLRWLWRYRPKSDDESLAWALWGGALSAWVVTVLIGTVNTTMHHEHAILSVLLLGMWLAYLRLNPREE